jgi:hypothetical protein
MASYHAAAATEECVQPVEQVVSRPGLKQIGLTEPLQPTASLAAGADVVDALQRANPAIGSDLNPQGRHVLTIGVIGPRTYALLPHDLAS